MRAYKLIFTNFLILMCLSACGSIDKNTLSAKYQDIPLEIDLYVEQVDEPLNFQIPNNNLSGGANAPLVAALALAVVEGVANSASKRKRVEPIAEVSKYIDVENFHAPMDNYVEVVKNSDWIAVNEVKPFLSQNYTTKHKKYLKYKFTEEPSLIGRIGTFYSMKEDFSELNQYLSFGIEFYDGDDFIERAYWTRLDSLYSPQGAVKGELEANYKLWTLNEGEELNKAIEETSKDLSQQFNEQLRAIKNP